MKFRDFEIRSQLQLWPRGHSDNMDNSYIPGKNILQGLVVGKPISSNQWINFNQGPSCLKADKR